jgi:hypothetical protein
MLSLNKQSCNFLTMSKIDDYMEMTYLVEIFTANQAVFVVQRLPAVMLNQLILRRNGVHILEVLTSSIKQIWATIIVESNFMILEIKFSCY